MYPARISARCGGQEDRAMRSPDTSGSVQIVRRILVVLDQRAGIDCLDYEYRPVNVAQVGEYSYRLDRTTQLDDGGRWVRDLVW